MVIAAAFAAVEHPTARFEAAPAQPLSVTEEAAPQRPPELKGSMDEKLPERAVRVILPSPYRR